MNDFKSIENWPDVPFELTSDLDLSGVTMQPLGTLNAGDPGVFSGSLNGNGHTIKNLTVVGPGVCGFIKNLKGSVSNIKFENLRVDCTASGKSNVNHLYGSLAALANTSAKVTNVEILSATITAKDSGTTTNLLGAAVGLSLAGATITNVKVNNLTAGGPGNANTLYLSSCWTTAEACDISLGNLISAGSITFGGNVDIDLSKGFED